MSDAAQYDYDFSDALMAVKIARTRTAAGPNKLPPPRTLTRKQWPPNYPEVLAWRNVELERFANDPTCALNAKKFYSKNAVAFINHWCDTYDPRNAGTDKPVKLPLVMFEKQEMLVRFLLSLLQDDESGLIEKCRDMGATWICAAFSVWMWLFWPGASIGWGSRKQELVDRIGDPDSIFEKIRMLIVRLPKVFLPEGFDPVAHMHFMRTLNPESGASITGEVGDNIGRGGRKRIYFKDESGHYERPELIEASLSETTRVQVDLSSVNGIGNVFYRKREAGAEWVPGAPLERGRTRVLVMDWRDHPAKSQAWYDMRRKKFADDGLAHVFAQEVDRDYSSSQVGAIIPREWVDACIDAHVRLGIAVEGRKLSALDIGDSEDGDRNALAGRTGVILTSLEEWTARDPGVTARKAIGFCADNGVHELQYDAVGLGSNVKSEVNRLKDDGVMPKSVTVVPWNAGGKVIRPGERVVEGDSESPRNKDYYANLKAQAWWQLRLRAYRTYQAVVGLPNEAGELVRVEQHPDDLFCIDGKLPLLHKLVKELCQATASKGSKLKLVVDKAPEGTRSPNLADAVVMAYWPQPRVTDEFALLGGQPRLYVGGENFVVS